MPSRVIEYQHLPTIHGGSANEKQESREYLLTAHVTQTTPTYRLMLVLTGTLSVFAIMLGTILVWQKPSTMTWGFFLYVMWFNPGLNFVFYAELQRYPYLVLVQEGFQAAAMALGYVGFIAFAIRFPRNVLDPRWRPLEKALPSIAVIFFILYLAVFGTAIGWHTEALTLISYGLGYLVPISMLLILRFRQKEQEPTDKQRTRWVHWACRIGLFSFMIADSIMSTSLWDPVVMPFCRAHWGVATLMCDGHHLSETTLLAIISLNATIPLSVFYAVRHYRVIEISFAIGRGMTLLLTSIVIASGLAYASIKVEDRLKDSLPGKFVLYVLLVMLMKLTFERLHEALNHVCDNVFFRHLHAAEKAVRRVAGELMHIAEGFGIDPVGWAEGRDSKIPLRGTELLILKQRGSNETRRIESVETGGARSHRAGDRASHHCGSARRAVQPLQLWGCISVSTR